MGHRTAPTNEKTPAPGRRSLSVRGEGGSQSLAATRSPLETRPLKAIRYRSHRVFGLG